MEIKAKVEKISQLTWPPGQYLAHMSYFGLLTKVHASSRELLSPTRVWLLRQASTKNKKENKSLN